MSENNYAEVTEKVAKSWERSYANDQTRQAEVLIDQAAAAGKAAYFEAAGKANKPRIDAISRVYAGKVSDRAKQLAERLDVLQMTDEEATDSPAIYSIVRSRLRHFMENANTDLERAAMRAHIGKWIDAKKAKAFKLLCNIRAAQLAASVIDANEVEAHFGERDHDDERLDGPGSFGDRMRRAIEAMARQ